MDRILMNNSIGRQLQDALSVLLSLTAGVVIVVLALRVPFGEGSVATAAVLVPLIAARKFVTELHWFRDSRRYLSQLLSGALMGVAGTFVLVLAQDPGDALLRFVGGLIGLTMYGVGFAGAAVAVARAIGAAARWALRRRALRTAATEATEARA